MSECKLCGKPIANVRGAWKEQVGWVSPKGAKGMTLAQQTGALAHDECVTLKRFGVNPEQQTLESNPTIELDEPARQSIEQYGKPSSPASEPDFDPVKGTVTVRGTVHWDKHGRMQPGPAYNQDTRLEKDEG